MTFVNASQVRTLASLPDSFGDTRLQLLVDSAVAAAEAYCRRPLRQATAVEYYDGTGSDVIRLRNWPVSAVTDVRVDRNGGYGQLSNTFGTDTVLDPATNYSFEGTSGRLILAGQSNAFTPGFPPYMSNRPLMARSGLWAGVVTGGMGYASWPVGRGNVRVSYTGGYPTASPALLGAIAEIVSYQSRAIPAGGRLGGSESFIDTSVTYNLGALVTAIGSAPPLASARGVLDAFREYPIAGDAR